ncbi:MAG: M4 family metallopeptidase [Bacteroidetes bacterium]|jgi:Zn-dependent metalloprotease|nr:M4 family metallopeptidase [Bacteroidota bacterium]
MPRLIILWLSILIVIASLPVAAQKIAGTSAADPFAPKRSGRTSPTPERRALFEQEARSLTARIAEARRRMPEAMSERAAALRLLSEINGSEPRVVWNEDGSTPIFISGRRLQSVDAPAARTIASAELQSRAFLREQAALLRLQEPDLELQRASVERDALGMVHIRYRQVWRGVEVWARDAVVHVGNDGHVQGINGRWISSPRSIDPSAASIDEATATTKALEAISGRGGVERSVPMILDLPGGPRLTWLVQVRGRLDENWHLFVDAQTGAVLKRYNHITHDGPVAGSGTDLTNATRALNTYQIGSTYYLIDASKAMFKPAQSSFPNDARGTIYTLDARNADSLLYFVTAASPTAFTTAKPAVSAAFYGSKVYDYFKTAHNRDAIDGKGSTMNIVVNFRQNFNNAFWNGQLMVFGNGDGTAFSDLAGSLDVMAHEMTHGVVENSANLIYENQPGALNESFADVFGVLFEFYVKGGGGNWLIGEDVTTPTVAGDALRNMQDPAAANVAFGGQQPGHMNQYQNLPNTDQGDHGGVHINSGIPNKAFYLFANSSGVTLEQAGQVYYRALTNYLTRNAQFVDCRLAVIKAAEDLFGGPGNAKAAAAAAAFDAVGILGGSSTPPPPTQNPVTGTSYLAVLGLGDGTIYRASAAGQSPTAFTGAAAVTRPSVTDDGQYVFYVDGSHNLHVIGSNGTGDQTLSSSGGFNNVSISPNGRYLAATTTFQESKIYVFDLQNSAGNKVLQLYTPTYSQGVTAGTIRYPDRIDWMSDNATIMYDALNAGTLASGGTVEYWDINFVRIADGNVMRLFPPQADGVNIGNAVFASNTDNIIAFDYFAAGDSVRVFAVNLNTGDVGQVTNNVFSLGSPSFSYDDRKVYYHYIADNGGTFTSTIWVVDLAADGVTGVGNDVSIVTGGIYPVSFTVGTRPTDVEVSEPDVPMTTMLEQNFPNPFNPETRIGWRMEEGGWVKVSVFDLLGREVAVLVNGEMPAGRHSATWHAASMPSGIYIARMDVSSSGGSRAVASRRMVLMK